MASIDGFIIDAAKAEEHTFPAEVTRFPVEKGANIADHVRRLPIKVVIEGVVSDTPIGEVAAVRGAATGVFPSDELLEHLEKLRETGEPVILETDLRNYDSMVLQNLVIPRTANTGDAIHFTATFEEVELVTNERTTIRVKVPRARRKKNRGNKPSPATKKSGGTAQDESKKTDSWAAKLAKALS